MPGQNVVFYGTTGPSGGAAGGSQPDPAQWLGRFRASQTLHELTSTITAAQVLENRHLVIDTARIGDGANAHTLKWMMVYTGLGALSVARVERFDDATGSFLLDRKLLGNAAVGNTYRLFAPNNVWPDVSPAQAVAGDERFRCIFARNENGAALVNVRVRLHALTVGGFELALVYSALDVSTQSFLQRADDTTDLFTANRDLDPLGGPDNFGTSAGGAEYWRSTFARAGAFPENASLPNNFGTPIWMRRQVPAGARKRASVAVAIVLDTLTAGDDPDPFVAGAVMAWDVLGDPSGSLQPDRYVAVGGGTRLEGTVLAEDGSPLADRPVSFGLFPGDPGAIATDDDPIAGFARLDAAGRAFVAYTPGAAATAGETARVQLLIPAGEEIADPHPFAPQLQSIDLNGTDEYMRSAQALVDIADVWSLSGWFRRTDAGTSLQDLMDIRTSGSPNNLIRWVRPGATSETLRCFVQDIAGALFKDFTMPNILVQNTWVHLAVTFDGGASGDPMIVYADGVDVTPASPAVDGTGTQTDTARKIMLGADIAGGSPFQGQVLDFAMHDIVLTPAEILATYNDGKGGQFDLNRDQGAYASRMNLKHWFRTGHSASPSIGDDFARDARAPLLDLDDEAVGITDADRVPEVPNP